MTAKSRRRKFDKRRKSDEHPQPRRSEEAVRRSESTRSRTGLIPRKREGEDASDEGPEQAVEFLRFLKDTIEQGRKALRGEFPESEFPKSLPIEGIVPLHEVDIEADGIGYAYGKKFYLNDQEKELYDSVVEQRKEALRAAGASHAAAPSGSSGTSGDA